MTRRRLAALFLLVGAVLGVGFALAAEASAHASVVASDPENGSRLKAAPASVAITFDEPVGLGNIGYLHVVDSDGKRVESGAAFHPSGDGRRVAVKLKAGLGDGTYTESFRIISADSHPVAGTVRFVVGNGVLSAAPVAGATVNRPLSVMYDVVRWISFGGLAALGGAWVLLTVWGEGRGDWRARRLLWTGWGAAVAGAVLELVLQGPYTAGGGFGDIATWRLLDTTLHTDYGTYHCVRLLLLGAVALKLWWLLEREPRRFDPLALVLLPGLALTFSATGHAATTSPDWLSIADDLVHVTAMTTWIGGIAMLLVAVLPWARDLAAYRAELDAEAADPEHEVVAFADATVARVVPVVSRVALTSVALIAVTGTYSAWRGVGSWSALFTTTYGVLVVIKVVLFLALIALANFARRAVHAMIDSPSGAPQGTSAAVDHDYRERMRRSVVLEVLLALAIFGASAVLVSEPRGKEALAAQHAKAQSAVATLGGGRTVTVTVDPGTHGTETVTVELSDGTKPQRVTGTATLAAKQLGPIPLGLVANGTNVYGASGVDLPAAGRWDFRLVITTSSFDATTVDVTVRLY